jgi:glycosyltransferase involved in cell wall biosynthesis
MRILLLAPEPFFSVRGTPLNIRSLSGVLGELGHEVHLLTYHLGEDVEIKNTEIHRILKVPFIKKVPVGPSYLKIILDFFLFFKALGMCLKNKYDLIHGVEEGAFLGVALKKIFKIPLIYDMDSSIPHQLSYTKFLRNKFLLRLVEFLERWTVNNSILVLTVCQNLSEMVKKNYPHQKVFQIEDVPIPFDGQDISAENIENLKEELGIKDETLILYTGNFENYQGIELLLKSAQKWGQATFSTKLILVGGEEEQIRQMRNLSLSLKISDFLIFSGKRKLEEIPLFLELADILVSPRLRGTNTPLKIFTYLQSGKPIVATRLLTHTQVLTTETAILTEPNPDAFAEGVARLLRDKDLRMELGRKGKELVERKYSYDNFFKKVEDVYKSI